MKTKNIKCAACAFDAANADELVRNTAQELLTAAKPLAERSRQYDSTLVLLGLSYLTRDENDTVVVSASDLRSLSKAVNKAMGVK